MAYLLDTNIAIHLRDGDLVVTERVTALDDAVPLRIPDPGADAGVAG